MREEAIKRLEDTFEAWERWECPPHSPAGLLNEALDMAIAALREQETVTICHHLEPVTIYRTNADHIRSMTDEELAAFLECFGVCHYCSEHERLENEPLLRGERCDEDCEKHMLNWLKQLYKEDA